MIVVQVLLYNESFEEIDALLSSLARVDYPKDKWRLILLNNLFPGHDIAGHFEKQWRSQVGVTLPETVFHSQTNNGFAGGHVSAYQIAKPFHPDYLYLLNADAVVDPGFLREVVRVAEENSAFGIIQSRIMLEQAPTLLNSCGNCLHFLGFGYSDGYQQTPEAAARSPKPHFYASGAGVLVRPEMVEKIGGLFYSDLFMYHDDVDLSWRARLAGYDIGYAEHSVIFHRYQFSKSIKKFYWMERNRHLINLINYKTLTLLLIAPGAIKMEIGTLFFALKSGWGKEKLRAWIFFLRPSTWLMIWARRERVAAFRKVSDRTMLSQMVGTIEAQEIENTLLRRFVNPVFNVYFRILKVVVRW